MISRLARVSELGWRESPTRATYPGVYDAAYMRTGDEKITGTRQRLAPVTQVKSLKIRVLSFLSVCPMPYFPFLILMFLYQTGSP
jgi:hypothetical protein